MSDSFRISRIELDEKTIIRRNADIDHERRVAIFDLLEQNYYQPLENLPGDYAGPFHILLRIEDNRLAMVIHSEDGQNLSTIVLPLMVLRRTFKEYFSVCSSYFAAIKSASPRQIETIDMARRGLHNEGADILMDRLSGKVKMDFQTARRLFTLISVLQIR